jgi:transcriptional regulator GlxA family with amidase domain
MAGVSRAMPGLNLEAIRRMSSACKYSPTALARSMGISVRQLQRLFKRYLCCSPCTWLREERLQLAREMLFELASVKEVALTLSYRQTSQFCRDFRSRFGYTPTELKKSRSTRYAETSVRPGGDTKTMRGQQ